MAALAEGLRAIPSVAEAAARPWPIPHPAAAIAMAIPAAAATQLVVPAAPSPWAKAGTAKHRADSAINTLLKVRIMIRIVFLSYEVAASGWLTLTWKRPHAERLKSAHLPSNALRQPLPPGTPSSAE